VTSQVHPGRRAAALGHPLRVALLDLLSRRPTLTATQAAGELGESSGACSFHLRQLERYGLVEEAPGQGGRVRPWRLASPGPAPTTAEGDDEFGRLARELENEGYRRWQAGRQTAPAGWHDEAFSAVVYLTPGELTEVAAAVRSVISTFAERDDPGDPGQPRRPGRESGRPAGELMPVGVVARMFPLLPASSDG
jgi:DNA-binding transcriptional ArsR family regulator